MDIRVGWLRGGQNSDRPPTFSCISRRWVIPVCRKGREHHGSASLTRASRHQVCGQNKEREPTEQVPSPDLELSIALRASVTLTSGQPLSSFNLKYNSYASSLLHAPHHCQSQPGSLLRDLAGNTLHCGFRGKEWIRQGRQTWHWQV